VISRVADNCFWFGRYLERAESTARLLNVTRDLVFDAELMPEQCWLPLVIVSGEHASFTAALGPGAAANGELVQRHMTWTPENQVSLLSSVRAAREVGRTIRDALSVEVWEEVNALYLWLTGADGEQLYSEQREDFYRDVRRRTQLCLGLVRSTMLHDDPMRFLWLGVMLERVGQTARILDMHHHTLSSAADAGDRPHKVVELGLWLTLLRACSGYDGFMKRHRGRVGRGAVASFLFFEDQFPRSLRYCLRSALATMRQLRPTIARAGEGAPPASLRELEALCAWFDASAPQLRTTSIHELLTGVIDRTSDVCSLLLGEMLGPPPTKRAAQSQSAGAQ
jgi:uncharacterized alpha-E superfamily protein